MKTIYCPALGIESVKKEFNSLVESVGEHQAYKLWDKYKGEVPKQYFKQEINSDINYQLPSNRSSEEFIASEQTIRDLAARMSDRIGIPVKFEADLTKRYKGKIDWDSVYINLAYATLDTPIHEILGHPIVRALKNKTKLWEVEKTSSGKYSIKPSGDLNISDIKIFNTKEEADNFVNNNPFTGLYNNLLKELEYGKGKEVLDRIKRDYVFKKEIPYISSINKDAALYYDKNTKTGYIHDNSNPNERKTFNSEQEIRDYLELNDKYTLEEQQEEAIVELLGLMTAEKLDNVKDGKLISLLKRLLKEMKQFVRSLLNQKEVEIDKLPDNMTLGDIADLLAYSNSKLILPGFIVDYTTPDNQHFKTYAEASKHINDLAKSVEEVDLSNIKINNQSNYKTFVVVNESTYEKEEFFTLEEAEEYKNEAEYEDVVGTKFTIRTVDNKPDLQNFIEKNKEYEQSKEIIVEWKKVNNIQYNPEEVYSRGQEFVSVVGAYSDFDVNLMMQNLLQHIEDNQKAGGEFTISAFTKPVDQKIGHLEGRGGKIKFKIYPQSSDILWAANTDVYSGSVWDASEKVNKDKKSELLGVSYTKYPSLNNVNSVQPNLASVIDNLSHHHNELGISLTGSNFRLEYDEDIPYSTKKIINSINSILDQKYGKLVKPNVNKNKVSSEIFDEISKLELLRREGIAAPEGVELFTKQDEERLKYLKSLTKIGIQPTQTNETLKESIYSIKTKLITPTLNNWRIIKGPGGKDMDWAVEYQLDKNTNVEFFNTEEEAKIFIKNLQNKKIEQKEYTSQALINTKIAKLKEVAKKYPKSLIRSEVRPLVLKDLRQLLMFKKGEELPFQKLRSKSSNTEVQTKPTKVLSKTQRIPVSEITKANINFGFYNEDPNTVLTEEERQQRELQVETFKQMFPDEAAQATKLHSFMMLPKMSMVEKEKLSQVFVNTFSEVLDYLSMTGPVATRDIEFDTIVDSNTISDEDIAILRKAHTTTNPRLEVMNKFGTEKVLSIVKNTMLEREVPEVSVNGILSQSERDRFVALKELIINDTTNNYFHHIINMANSRLQRVEEFMIDIELMKPVVKEITPESAINPDPAIDGLEDNNDENTTEDNWMLSYLRRSFVGNLSKEIKTKFARIIKRDPLTDDVLYNEFGGIEYYNDNDIYNRIMEIIFAQPTVAKQLKALEAQKELYPWVEDVLEILNSDPVFKTRFFVNFRKDNIQYYKVWRSKGKDGKYIGKIVNYDTLSDKFKEDLIAAAKSRAIKLYQQLPDANQLDERTGVKVNVEELGELLGLLKTLKKSDNVLTHSKVWKSADEYKNFILGTEENPGVINSVMEVLHRIGVMGVNRSVLEKVLFHKINIYTTTSIEKDKTPYTALLTQIEGLLHKVKISGLDPKYGALGGKDNKDEIIAYKTLYRKFEKFIEQPVEKIIHSNGANYYAYAAPNFINRLVTKLNSLSNQEVVDYIETEYFDTAIHGRFMNHEKYGKYFSSWLQDIYLDAKKHLANNTQDLSDTERSKFKFDTFLANDKKEFSELLPHELIETALKAYQDGVGSYKAKYMLPILADKGVSGFITWRKDSSKQTVGNVTTYTYKDNIVDKLYGVFMQEVDRINTLRVRRENRITNKMIPLAKYDLDPNGKNYAFDKGDRFVFLPMLQDYFTQVYVKEDQRPAVEVLRKLLTSKHPSEVRMSELLNEDNIAIIKEVIQQGLESEISLWKANMIAIGDYNTVKRNMLDSEATNEQFDILLNEFFYNNYYAQTQIMQLTVGDVAFYSSVDDLQKRLAQLRAPGIAYDVDAVNVFDTTTKIPQKFTEDGIQRSIVISDFMQSSQKFDIISKIYNDHLAKQLLQLKEKYKTSPNDSKQTIAFKKKIIATTYKSLQLEYQNKLKNFTADKLNASDGQSIIGLPTIRKMEGTLGRWSQEKENLYQKVKNIILTEDISLRNKAIEALSYDEFRIIFETRKPFGYGVLKTPALDGTIAEDGRPMNIIRGVQAKDAEAVLLDMFSMLKSGDEFLIALNKLFFTSPIDVIHTESTIKTGVQGVINLREFKDTEQFTDNIIALFKDPSANAYKQTVLEIPFENIVLQVETPSKFEDKDQPMGTQQSKIIFEGLSETDEVVFQGNSVNARDLERFYEQVIATKVKKSYNKLLEELGITEEIRKLLDTDSKTFLTNRDPNAVKARLTMNVKLSKLLLSQMTDSNRFSFDLIMAASLNEAGEFIIPLNDELQFDRIQQLLNAIIKDRITKQSTAGAQLIQVSDGIRNGAVSLDKALQIVWNYDAEGSPISLSHLEAELPMYQKAFYEHFIDEEGYLHPEWMPEDMRNAVAYRIPSEGLCSMIPIKIVRFSNKMNGGIIKLPAEITAITGADFDIDKLFIMFPSVVKNNFNKQELYSTEGLLSTKYKSTTYYDVLRNSINASGFNWEDFSDIRQLYKYLTKANRLNDVKIARGIFNKFLTTTKRVQNFYTVPKVEVDSAEELKEYAYDPEAINSLLTFDDKFLNNTILDINLAVLQNQHNLFASINPSGFDNLTRITNIISIVRAQPNSNLKRDIYNSLTELSNSEISSRKKLVTREPNYFSFNTQVQLHKRNFVGQSLIGIGANGNSSHAILQHYDIKLLPTFHDMPTFVTPLDRLVLNGIKVRDLMKQDPKTGIDYIPFSSVYNHTGVIKISNGIREFLAAAVDSAKLPIFDDANINKITITVAEVILRLGLDLDSTVLLLNQPIMLEFLNYILKKKGSVDGSASSLINGFLESIKIKDALMQTQFNSDLLNEELAENIGISYISLVTDEQALSNQIQAFKFLIPMIYLSEDVRMLNVEAKQDSIAAAPGPQISETKAKEGHIEYFNTKVRNRLSFFHPQTSELLNSESPYSSPMLSTYHEKTKQASNYIFGVINPMYFYEFEGVLNKLQSDSAEALGKKTIKKLQDDFALFKLFMFDPTNRDNDELALEDETAQAAFQRVIRGHKNATKYYTLEFPKKIADTLYALKKSKEFEKNFFIQSLRLSPAHKNSEVLVLTVDSIGMNPEDKRALGTGWADLILGDNLNFGTGYTTRELGLELIVFSLYRNGFAFGNSSFLYALSPEIKARLPKYLSYLRNSSTVELTDNEEYQFLNLFKRHNHDLKGVVPTYTTEEIKEYYKDTTTNEKAKKVIEFTSEMDLGSIIKVSSNKYEFVLYERVYRATGGYSTYKYRIVTPLGMKGVGKEYTPDMMTSFGHTKKSIYLTNDYGNDLFNKDNLTELNFDDNLESNKVDPDFDGASVSDPLPSQNQLNPQLLDSIIKNQPKHMIRFLLTNMLSDTYIKQYNLTEDDIKLIQDTLEQYC